PHHRGVFGDPQRFRPQRIERQVLGLGPMPAIAPAGRARQDEHGEHERPDRPRHRAAEEERRRGPADAAGGSGIRERGGARGRMSTANMSAPTVSDIAMLNRNFAAGRPKRTTVPGSLSRVGFAALVKNSAATPTQKPRRTTMGTAALWVKRVIGSKTGELTA